MTLQPRTNGLGLCLGDVETLTEEQIETCYRLVEKTHHVGWDDTINYFLNSLLTRQPTKKLLVNHCGRSMVPTHIP